MEPNSRPDTEEAGGVSSEGRLPSGTVTLLFSDIEGSTRMLQELGASYERVLEQHDALMRDVFRRWRGWEFGHEGDAFFVSFASASDALGAAVEAQQRLARHAWPDKPVRVRIGLHTGTPTVLAHDYVGIDVHRAARICAAGHGGQIVVSQSTRALVGDDFVPEVELRDLGEHQLPDLDRPEHLYQVAAPGLAAAFPPLRSMTAVMNLPSMPTPLVGREREMAEVEGLLRAPGPRLVTLLGPGGTGKTRLAVQIARRLQGHYPGGVGFVALANVSDVALVAGAMARALGVDPGAQTPSEAIEAHLRDRHMLLVLDNFEHVIEAADFIGHLLTTCPALEVLVTSRTALRLSGEHEYGVPPLSVPQTDGPVSAEAVRGAEAVTLFRQRARAVRPDFEITEANARSVAEICRSLDGLPLAIELAAARIRLMAPEALASRLDRHLKLLTGGPRDAPARQRTLRGAIEWSHDLLTPTEQIYFRRFAAFVGGWTLDSVEPVIDPDGELDEEGLEVLSSLLDKTLVRREDMPVGDTRFAMLHTIRAYARERLQASADAGPVLDRHARYFLELAETADTKLLGPEQAEWYERLEAEHDNLRAALQHGVEHRTAEHVALRLAGALGRFWYTRGYIVEGIARLEAALTGQQAAPPEHRARALQALGVLLAQRTEHERSKEVLSEALSLQRELGNDERIAVALNSLGIEAYVTGELAAATELLEEALAIRRRRGDEQGIPTILTNLGNVALLREDVAAAEQLLEEALALDRRHGNEWGVGVTLTNLSAAVLEYGDADRAEALLSEAIPIFRRLGERDGLADCLERAVGIASLRREWRRAAALAGAAAALRQEVGSPLVDADARRLEGYLAPCRAHLDPSEFDAAFEEGRATPLEQTLERLAPSPTG